MGEDINFDGYCWRYRERAMPKRRRENEEESLETGNVELGDFSDGDESDEEEDDGTEKMDKYNMMQEDDIEGRLTMLWGSEMHL